MKENFVQEWHQSGDINIAHTAAEAGVMGGDDNVTKRHFWPIGDITSPMQWPALVTPSSLQSCA
eukprot:9124094-Ditylum_brightwellii.AAC.1